MQDAVATVRPDVAEIGAPAQLEDELVPWVNGMACPHALQHLGQRDEAVGDIGRQPAHGAVQRMAGACIGVGMHRPDTGPGSRQGRGPGVIQDRVSILIPLAGG